MSVFDNFELFQRVARGGGCCGKLPVYLGSEDVGKAKVIANYCEHKLVSYLQVVCMLNNEPHVKILAP